jgi:DNA mismatch repair protein MutL
MEVRLPIRILPEDVASAIAAGEVVERPASVVKELIENALDAGARRIDVTTEGGGVALIEVADDGHGIPPAEVPLAVERYATSKLSSAEDLFDIRTLGFRGEALSSIGAVSRLELVTKVQEEDAGTKLIIDGGDVRSPQAVGAPQGTVVRVRELFYNVPARRKFLKTELTERRWISTLVTRYALAYPEVRFSLTQDGRTTFQSTGSGDRREVLGEVFGVEAARQMIPLPAYEDTPIKVQGFISPPSLHRGSRRQIIFFVNGRLIQDPSLSTAVVQAYHALLMVGRYPMAVILLDVPADSVDVNVHPTKNEIRFRDQNKVFSILQRVVRATLLGQTAAPEIQFDSAWRRADSQQIPQRIPIDWQLAADLDATAQHEVQQDLIGARSQRDIPLLRAVGQVGAAYLVAEGPDGLYLIDQHAAHERVLFEALMAAHKKGTVEAQALLETITVDFSPDQAQLLESQIEALNGLGFDVEHFGQRTFQLRAIPALLTSKEPEQVLRAVVDEIDEDETPLAAEAEARLAARVCKRASVKAGQVLSLPEQEQLLRDLEACESPRTCPHGRPTMIHLPVEALERQFGRRG